MNKLALGMIVVGANDRCLYAVTAIDTPPPRVEVTLLITPAMVGSSNPDNRYATDAHRLKPATAKEIAARLQF